MKTDLWTMLRRGKSSLDPSSAGFQTCVTGRLCVASLWLALRLLLVTLLAFTAFSARAGEEQDLITILQSDANAIQKCEACKKLRTTGTARSVPTLAVQLTDERVSQAARHALEGLPYPEASAALREALGKTSGLLQVGMVDSLGWRHDVTAVPLLKPLLSEADATIASATATALGRIGGQAALAALEAARNKVQPGVRPAVLESLLRCAESSLAEGNLVEARRVYQSLAGPTETEHIRVAAHAGLIRAAGEGALKQIQSVLESSDPATQAAALQLAGDVRDAQATQTFANLLRKSSPALQVALLALLQTRGDATALRAVLTAARSADAAVRAAAFAALGKLGDASAVTVLAEAATSHDASEQTAARNALAALSRGDIAGALVAQLRTATPAVQVELARALTTRAEQTAVPALLELARSDQPATRKAALQALGRLTDGSQLGALVQLLAATKDEEARAGVRGVFESLAERTSGIDALDVTPIVNALDDSDLDTRKALFQVSALFADARLRAAFRAAVKDGDDRVRAAAARALCDTRDPELLPDLLELARQTSDSSLQALALEGGVRLATEESAKLSTPQRTKALAAVSALAARAEDKRMVLSGLARVPTATTLKLADQASADPAVKAEADLACLQIAQKLGGRDFEAAAATLTRLAATAGNPTVQTNAQTLLRRLNSGWLCAGPYRQPGKQAQDLFDIAFPPEGGAAGVTWQRAPGAASSSRPGEVDLGGITGGDHCVVYLKTRIYVAVAQPVLFSIGTDDGIKLWVNRELVHANNAVRGLTPDQDKAKARLRQGWNDVLAKITQHTAGCGMTFRVTEDDGKEVPGLRLDPRGSLTRANTGFKRIQLSDEFYAEGAYFGDFNRDGKLDVVAGPFWFAGSDFTTRQEYRPVKAFSPKDYSDNFLTFAGDCNGDGWTDIVCVPFPGKEGYWYENPRNESDHWRQHLYYPMVGNESPVWGDVTGDGRPELLFCNEGYLGYAGPNLARPNEPWVFRAISQQDKRYQRFTHGVGYGDINGDQRVDIVEAAGWWEQPADAKPDEPWKYHPFRFADAGAQMLVYDVNGDGQEDIITSWHCHQYGLIWWQQIPIPGQSPDWKQHVILPPKPDLQSPDLRASQLHAFDLVDMNGDGLKDIVTGKRFWAHGPAGDPEPNAPAVVYWFELRREVGGKVSFVPHLIDDDSGVGTQVATADLNGDSRPDVIVGNKKGIFIHLSQPTAR